MQRGKAATYKFKKQDDKEGNREWLVLGLKYRPALTKETSSSISNLARLEKKTPGEFYCCGTQTTPNTTNRRNSDSQGHPKRSIGEKKTWEKLGGGGRGQGAIQLKVKRQGKT